MGFLFDVVSLCCHHFLHSGNRFSLQCRLRHAILGSSSESNLKWSKEGLS